MRWRQSLGIAALALAAGIAGLVAGSFTSGHGPPQLLTDGLSSTRATRWIADAWIAATQPRAPNGVVAARPGDLRPDLGLVDIDGKAVDTSAWQGKRVVLNFWASWCGPCLEEMPALDRFAHEHGNDDVLVIGLAQDDVEPVRAFLTSTPVRYPILFEDPPGGNAGIRFGNAHGVLPFTVMIDRDARIVEQRMGKVDDDRLREWLRAHP